MMRVPFSLLAGVVLAVTLFWLLALLVTPPEADIEVMEPTAMSLVDVDDAAEPAPAEAASVSAPPPPAAAPAEPPPLPEPPPLSDSAIALPEPELPAPDAAPLELDEALPELTEQSPPEPQPEPQPMPEREPAPEPPPEPAAAPSEASPVAEAAPGDGKAESAASPSEADSQEPVDVGTVTPTQRVSPQYPARAQRRGLEGYVELVFVIRPDGSVDASSIQVVEARPRNVFDTEARQAVARWQFESGRGLRRARQRLEFQLR